MKEYLLDRLNKAKPFSDVDYEHYESDIHDDIHNHFEEFGRWNWVQIGDEGRRVWNLLFSYELQIENNSPADGVFYACAAQASYGAYAAMAAALGVDADALQTVIAAWHENQDAPPLPITAERLIKLCKQERSHENAY